MLIKQTTKPVNRYKMLKQLGSIGPTYQVFFQS